MDEYNLFFYQYQLIKYQLIYRNLISLQNKIYLSFMLYNNFYIKIIIISNNLLIILTSFCYHSHIYIYKLRLDIITNNLTLKLFNSCYQYYYHYKSILY
jgi:hypothetical protein